jgi:cobalt-zinc-cadmium efflux system membrane fusion protein
MKGFAVKDFAMKNRPMNRLPILSAIACAGLLLAASGCEKKGPPQETAPGTGPAAVTVETDLDPNNFKVDHPERFPLVAAGEHVAAPELNVNGVVSADISRQLPVPSLATGRVVEIDARLGDEVKKGQLLFKVRSTDIAGAYSDYRKALQEQRLATDNERLTKIQLNRANLLYGNGSIPKSQLEIAENAEIASQTALDTARVDVETSTEHLKLLGSDPEHPTGIVEVFAPTSGTITDQQITDQSGVQALTPPNPFTISDMSKVWIICDVWENNMSQVHIGEYADIHLAAYPDRVLKARISNILPVIDPTIRTAKVRLEVDNPGILRLGMFVTATFHGMTMEKHSTVPSTAILHLHDRQWVYTPTEVQGRFKRLEVVAGETLPGNIQEVVSGLMPGTQVITNALVFQNTVEQ